MSSLSSAPSESAPKSSYPPGKKLRTSCDLCQELKIKCSQDKPACERCVKQQLSCTYSPLRRIGRPRKSPSITQNDRAGATTKRSAQGQHPQPKKNRNDLAVAQLQEPDVVDHEEAAISSTTTDDFNMAFMDTASITGADKPLYSLDPFSPLDFSMVLGPQDNLSELGANTSMAHTPMRQHSQYPSSQGMATINTSPGRSILSGIGSDASPLTAESWLLEKLSPFPPPSCGQQLSSDRSSTLTASHTSTSTRPISRAPTTSEVPHAHGRGREAFGGGRGTEIESECQGECYMALPQRLAQFEQGQAQESQPPAMDFVLAADKDMWALKERLFACRRHIPSRTSILILALLAEHIILQLEKLFRFAALLGQAMEQVVQTQWPMTPKPGTSSARMQRPVHSLFDRSMVCPMPEVKCDILIGDYEVDAVAKERAVKRILRRRIRALMVLMTELKGPLRRNSLTLGNMLEQDRGSTGLDYAVGNVVDDLCRRIEYLQGRIEFAD